MDEVLRLGIYGLASAGVYFVAASGLVLTYQTSGIFNFAHGAIGMMAAFTYWELRFNRHWPAPLALIVVLGVLAPLFGALIERTLIRRVQGASLATTLVVTVGLLAALMGIAQAIWSPGVPRPVQGFFGPTSGFDLGGVFVKWHAAITVMIAIAVAIGLWAMFRYTRLGIAMRAVVDNRALAALNGVQPGRVMSASWTLGAMLAALSGVLLASVLPLDVAALTLLVINAYAAAVVGRLKSFPLTLLGAVILGMLANYVPFYVPKLFADNQLPEWLQGLNDSIPVIMLFIVLLILPRAKVSGWTSRMSGSIRVPGLRASVVGAAALIAGAALVSAVVDTSNLHRVGQGLALALIVLSLVPLTGYAGQVSLCQMTFAGLGAFAMYKVGSGGDPLGLLAAVVLAAAVGALIALPALRLQGLYLALSTLAFAVLMEKLVFPTKNFFYGSVNIDRLKVAGVSFNGERAYFILMAAAFGVLGVVVLALRRGPFGRRLIAMRDSPAACTTLGLDLTRTKLAVFAFSAGMAGLGGALFAGWRGGVSTQDFAMVQSLPILLLAVIGGIATVSGALVGGAFFAALAIISADVSSLDWLVNVAPGLTGITLASNPDGLVVTWGTWLRAQRGHGLSRGRTEPVVDLTVIGPSLPLGAPLTREQVQLLDRTLGAEEVDCVGAAAD